MNRSTLLRTLSVAALAAFSAAHAPAARAASLISGGGATAPEYNYIAEESLFNSNETLYQFDTYHPLGSASAQNAFITNTPSAFGAGLTFDVEYVASDSALASTQYANWTSTSNTAGAITAGGFIQLPSLGTAPSFPVVNSAVMTNGGVALTDDQLCGIFSGLLTDWSQISASLTPGLITVVYRSDTSASTQFLTNHWFATSGSTTVCNNTNSTFASYTPTNLFTALFPVVAGKPVLPSNFVGEKGSLAVAQYLTGTAGTTVTSAIGFISPDFTSLYPTSDAFTANPTLPNTLTVAAIFNGRRAYTPTTANIILGLAHPGAGATDLVPPTTQANAANPLNWVPVIPLTTTGYPYVGYGTLDFAQCYADPAVASGALAYLGLHYNNANYRAIQARNGLVPISKSKASPYLKSVAKVFLSNKNKWNLEFQDATACAGLTGR